MAERTADVLDRLRAAFNADPNRAIEPVRAALANLPPLQLVNACFARQYASHRWLELELAIATCRGSRSRLFEWVYGESALTKAATSIRLASLSKRQFVFELRNMLKRKYPWITSRVIHAYAFAPEHFGAQVVGASRMSWGPLYREISVPKGSRGRRVLQVPNRPLARVQRALLEIIAGDIVSRLPPFVMGIGGPDRSIFANAAQHVRQRFVATFDIKSFFDAVRTEQVIAGLLEQEGPMFAAEFSRPPLSDLPRVGEKPPKTKVPLPWRHDAAVLVARLCTFRGRLPQGAPTSPLLANVAFLPFDKKICEELGDEVVYTRYFDDITVSVSTPASATLNVRSPEAFAAFAKDAVTRALNKRFRLNPEKAQFATLDEGLRVTGLRVSHEGVGLPRVMRRSLKALEHRLRRDGLVGAARRLIGDEVLRRTQYDDRRERHFLRRQRGPSRSAPPERVRRMSTERMAVLLLRQTAPGLVVELMPDEVSVRREGTTPERLKGRAEWAALEKALSRLW